MLVPKLVFTRKGFHRAPLLDALGDESVLGHWEPTVVLQERLKRPRNPDLEATRRKP